MNEHSKFIDSVFEQEAQAGSQYRRAFAPDNTPAFGLQTEESAPTDQKDEPGLVSDAWSSFGMGAGSLVSGMGWLFDSETLSKLGKDTTDYWESALSDAQREAGQERFVEDDWSIGSAVTNPRSWMGVLMQSIPAMTPGMGVAGLASKGAIAAGLSRGAATAIGAGAASGAEGTVIASMVGDDVYQTVLSAPDEQIEQSPYYQDLMEAGVKPEAARKQLAEKASVAAAAPAGVLGAVLGVAFNKFVSDAVTGSLSNRILKEGRRGAAIESGTELAQTGAEVGATQKALNEYLNQPYDYAAAANEMVAGTGAGGITGGVVGVAGGLAGSAEAPSPADTQQSEPEQTPYSTPGATPEPGTQPRAEQGITPDAPLGDIGPAVRQSQESGISPDQPLGAEFGLQPEPEITTEPAQPQGAPLSERFGATDTEDAPRIVFQQDGITVTQEGESGFVATQDEGDLNAFGENPADARRKLNMLIERNKPKAPVLQNRDRSGRGYIEQMERIAAEPDYDQVSISKTPEAGAPMVFAQGQAATAPESDLGRNETITMSDGKGGNRKIKAQYAVVEASVLKASHSADGKMNEGYGKDGLIALNNGRTAGLQEAYNRGTADDYRQAMLDDAGQLGVDPAAIRNKTNPVLIRLFDGAQLQGIDDPGAASNTERGASLSLSERAQTDARKLTPDVLAKLKSGDPLGSDNSEFIASAIEAISSGEANTAMRDDNGLLTSEGQKRLRGALIERAFSDKALTNELVEATDSDLKTFGDALQQVAGRWALMRERAKEGSINPDMDITDALVAAVNMIRKSRQEGIALKDLAGQVDAFAGEVDQMAVHILSLFYRGASFNRARPKAIIAGALLNYTETALQTSAGADMFGNITTPSQVLERERGQLEGEQQEEAAPRVRPDGADNRAGRQEGERPVGRTERAQDAEEGAAAEVEDAATEADTAPTEAQKEAGNYRKGHTSVQGLNIAIENPKGSTRSGTDPDGQRWENTMAHHYGYLKRTEGADGDQVDVFIGPNPDSDNVFIVDQVNADGSFDEHKVLLGFPSKIAARRGYLANYQKGWKVGPITPMTMSEFKSWLAEGDTTRPAEPQADTAPDLDLTTQTETELAEQADAKAEAEKAEARQRKQAEQKEKADAEADNFVLSGSNSPIDQAEARGQGNMFDTEQATEDSGGVKARRSSYRANPNQQDLFADPQDLEALKNVDPYENAETRPGTTEAQRDAGRSALRDLLRQLNARYRRTGRATEAGGGISLLGAAMYKNFKAGKPNQLIGQTVRTPQDLAALAQVYRDPRFETFRLVLTKNGKVVTEQAVTSRLPSSVRFHDDYIDDLRSAMKATGADGYYMMHNHPSGKSEPSTADLRATLRTVDEVPGFLSHVVIDHNEFSTIDKYANVELTKDESLGSTDFWSNPDQPNDLLGFKIGKGSDVAELAKKLQNDQDRVVFIGADAKNKVTLLTSLPASLMMELSSKSGNRAEAIATLRRLKRASGSGGYAFLAVNDKIDVRTFAPLINDGIIMDVVDPDGNSGQIVGDLKRYPGDVIETNIRGMRIADEVDGYQGQTDSPAFRKWFGNSKVVDENGEPLVVYHASNQPITEFKREKIGAKHGHAGDYGGGFYFSSDQSYTDRFGSEKTEVYLSLQNPLVILDGQNNNTGNNGNIYREFKRVLRSKDPESASRYLRENGFDGVVVHGEGGSIGNGKFREVVAFRPSQIKSATENAGTFDPDTPDIRFSRTGPRNLFVAHNLSESNLEHVLELGGLAAPSLAVGRTDRGFDDFGEITLLAPSSIIESSKARTFDADVYTPRHPRAEYKIDRDAFQRQRDSLGNDLGLNHPDISDLERDGMEGMARSYAYQYAWLQSKGKAPKLKLKKVDPAIRQLAKLGLNRYEMQSDPKAIRLAEKHYRDMQRRFEEVVGKEDARRERLYFDEDGNLDPGVLYELAVRAEQYRDSGGYDTAQMKHDLLKKMRPKLVQRQYEKWIKDRFNEVMESPRMFDGFTPSGNRRYKPYDLENVVKVMTRTLQGGEGFNYGAGSVRSTYAKEFKRVSQVQANRDRIVSPEEMERIKEESNDRLMEVLSDLKPYYRFDADSWGYTDDASSAIAEGPKGWREAFDLDTEGRALITEFTDYLKTLPTAYFETKVGRAVDLSEFSVALVPKGTSKEAVQALRDKGLKVKRYDPADPDSRREEIAKQEGLLFSRDGEFRRTSSQATPNLTATQAESITDTLMADWEGKPKVVIADRISEFPKRLRDAIRAAQAEGDMRGVYFEDKVYILASRIPSRAALEEVVLHEVVGHYGLRTMMGADLKPLLNQVYLNFAKTPEAKKIIRTYYGNKFNASNSNHRLTVAEELLAHLAETGKHQKLWNKIVAAVREGLRKLGFTLEMTEADLLGILAGAQKTVEQGGISRPSEADNHFSRTGQNQTDTTPITLKDEGQTEGLATGQPVTFNYRRNTQSAESQFGKPKKGDRFARDVEPAGRYMNVAGESAMRAAADLPNMETGQMTFRNPIVVENNSFQWKRDLSKQYGGLTGRELSEAVLADGHDGIITLEPSRRGPYISEVVDLTAVGVPANADIRFSRMGNRLDAAADHFTDLNDVERSALGKIAPRTPNERAADWWRERSDRWTTKVRQGAVDRFAALKDLDEAAYGKDVVEGSTASSSWVLSQMSGAASGALQSMLTAGRIKLNAREKVIDMQEGTRSLNDVLKGLGSAAEIERFFGWIAGNRSRRLMAEGRENLFTPEEVDALAGLNRGNTDSGQNRGMLYASVFSEFQQYRDDVLSIAEGAGIITPEQRETWANEFYVPFYRLAENDGGFTGPKSSGGITRQEAYKKLKGGSQNLNDLLENTMMNFHHLLQASLKNQAAIQATDNAEMMGIAREVREADRDTENSTFILRDGQKVWYEIDDPLVFKAVTALAHPGMNSSAMKTMRGFKRLFTNLTTTTPQFVIANLLRDSMQASATSEVSKNFLKNMTKGSKAYGDPKIRARMMATGGSFSFGHLYGENADEMRLQITGGLARADILRNPSMVPDAVRGTWRKWNEMTEFTENINRAAIFEANREQKGELYAAFKARDLMNFSQHGAWPAMRVLIDVVPFLNARIQGLDKIYRSGVKPGLAVAMGQGSATDKQAAARFWSVTGALALASIALYLSNRDDEEYKKLEEWQKDTYWFLRVSDDHAIFIPKPFEVGAIATLVERLTEQAVSDTATGELFAERLGHMLMSTFSFSPIPQMAQPALDVYANYDAFTGRPIEGMGMDRLSPELRRRVSTTAPAIAGSNVSGAVSELWGGEGLSPVQVDHLIQGYFGSVGSWVAGVTDTIWKTANGEESPSQFWYENQPIRRFYKNLGDEDRYTRYGTEFYKALRETNRVYADIKEYMELGDVEKARSLYEQNQGKLAYRAMLNKSQRKLSKLNKAMERIRRMEGSPEYKRRELDRIRAIKNAIQQAVGQRIEQSNASG